MKKKKQTSSDVPGGVSITKTSKSSHNTSVKNCLITALKIEKKKNYKHETKKFSSNKPFFFGPLQIIGSVSFFNRNAIDITAKDLLESVYTGTHLCRKKKTKRIQMTKTENNTDSSLPIGSFMNRLF